MLPDVGVESAHLSQQLAVMRRAGIVGAKREGSSMIYSVLDPQIFELLNVAKQIIINRLTTEGELLADLGGMKDAHGPRRSKK